MVNDVGFNLKPFLLFLLSLNCEVMEATLTLAVCPKLIAHVKYNLMKDEKLWTLGSIQRKLTLLFVRHFLGKGTNKSLLWGLAYKPYNRGKSLFYCELVWLQGTVLCVAYVHPDLGSDQNTLNQLGPNEGHFVVSFILYIREMPGLQGCGKQSQRPEQHNTQSQYRSVYNTHKQKHKADAGDTQREGNGMKNIS